MIDNEYEYYTEEGLKFIIHFWEDEIFCDVDYEETILLLNCGNDLKVLI